MHKKNITKSFIFLILAQMIILSGCSRRESEMVFIGPDQAAIISEKSDDGTSDDTTLDAEDNSETPAENAGSKGSTTDTSAENAGSKDSTTDTSTGEDEAASSDNIMVHVCGAVLCEGVYELPKGSRVVDAVKAAGGFSEEADSEYVNQALVLSDGVKVRIPTLEETVAGAGEAESGSAPIEQGSDTAGVTGMYDNSGSSSDSEGGKVNINTADETELCSIPGIGPGRAKNIISYREEKGKFGTIEDIKKVSGIKDKFFSKIKDYITV